MMMQDWREEFEEALPLLGHRNFIQIADMAFPALTASGVQTLWTDEDLLSVLNFVLRSLQRQKHIRPIVWIDAELEFVKEGWAEGITEFREKLRQKLIGLEVKNLPHEQLITKLSEAGQQFRILVLKTKTCLPYTSVFLELDCAYWDERREQALRSLSMDYGSG